MKNIGLIVSTLSLAAIAFYDFKFNRVPNLSLVILVVSLAILMPSENPTASLIRFVSAWLALALLNLSLRKSSKTLIQPGDVKLILILTWFFNIQELSLAILVASVSALALALITKQPEKKTPLGGFISLAVAIILFLT